MTDSQPDPSRQLDYQRPIPVNRPWPKFIGGLAVGTALTMAAVPLTLLISFTAGKEGRDPSGEMLALIPAIVLIATIIVCTVPRRTRPFGLGMLAGVPAAVLAWFVICGGMRY